MMSILPVTSNDLVFALLGQKVFAESTWFPRILCEYIKKFGFMQALDLTMH